MTGKSQVQLSAVSLLTLERGNMGKHKRDSRGFTLIAALLLTLLLSAMAVGLLYLVSNEQRMGGNDLEGNLAYYGAESGIENLTAQLSQLYQTSQTPNVTSLCGLVSAANYPTAISGSNITNMGYVENITWPPNAANLSPCTAAVNPVGTWDIVGSGPDQGMVASLVPFNLTVTATRAAFAGESTSNSAITPTGASVNLTRTVEVALLPAFEFGVFCDGDCDYFAGPNFNFGGRVHTNGNLFLASGAALTFTDKIAAVGQVIMDQLENGHSTSSGYGGAVYVPAAAGACPNAPTPGPAGADCAALPSGSWTGGFPPTGAAVANWRGVSTDAPTAPANPLGFNSFIINGLTGATKLQLPFVQSDAVGAIEIIRRPQATDSALLTSSRLYSEAAIRILLADTQADLTPDRGVIGDGQNVELGTPNASPFAAVASVATGNGATAGKMYYATALKGASTNNWTSQAPTGCTATLASWPLFGQVTSSSPNPLCSGAWLRVEYWSNTSQAWVGVTTQWLGYGFGRNYDNPPTHPYNTSTATAPYCQNYPSYPANQCQNGISPAILILQQLQSSKAPANATGAATTANNWLPINFYDSREGEPRDTRQAGDVAPPSSDCSPNGIMNTVELDIGNLWLWLQASGPYSGGSGKLVSTTNQNGTVENGYIIYFMDHRGMIPDAHPFPAPVGPFYNGFSGMSGLNDVVNSGSQFGVPNGTLEAISYYATATPTPYSPEDTAVKGTGILGTNVDNWGEKYLGAGFGISAANMNQPYYIPGSVTTSAVQCYSGTLGTPTAGTAEWNMVSGPRHVLRLVDGGMDSAGNSFVPPTGVTTLPNGQVLVGTGGFTVASEEPVYVYGDYNTGINDPFWPSENTPTTPHSSAAIIADAVTLLSNPPSNATKPTSNTGWYDQESFLYPQQAVKVTGNAGRQGNNSYYRVAIAAGKSIPFPQPAWGAQDFGTDGGMHNFLRYLEDRSDNGNGGTVNYAGSLISMYYSQYATGTFKCCNSTYSAPLRNYFFDTQFLNPNNLPPGTPEFQDVVSLGFHQNFSAQ